MKRPVLWAVVAALIGIIACSGSPSRSPEKIATRSSALTIPTSPIAQTPTVGAFMIAGVPGLENSCIDNIPGQLQIGPCTDPNARFALTPSAMKFTTGREGTIIAFGPTAPSNPLCLTGNPVDKSVTLAPCDGTFGQEWQYVNEQLQMALASNQCVATGIGAAPGPKVIATLKLSACTAPTTPLFLPLGFPINLYSGLLFTLPGEANGPNISEPNCLATPNGNSLTIGGCFPESTPDGLPNNSAFFFDTGGQIETFANQCMTAAGPAPSATIGLNGCSGGSFADPASSAPVTNPLAQWATAPGFQILNSGSGACLDVQNGATLPGTPVDVAPCNGSLQQQWSPSMTWPIPNLIAPGGACTSDADCKMGFTCSGNSCQGEALNYSASLATGDVDGTLNLTVHSDGTWSYTGFGHFDCGCSYLQYVFLMVFGHSNDFVVDGNGDPFLWFTENQMSDFNIIDNITGNQHEKQTFSQSGFDPRIEWYWQSLKNAGATGFEGTVAEPLGDPVPLESDTFQHLFGHLPNPVNFECSDTVRAGIRGADSQYDGQNCYISGDSLSSNAANEFPLAVECVGRPPIDCGNASMEGGGIPFGGPTTVGKPGGLNPPPCNGECGEQPTPNCCCPCTFSVDPGGVNGSGSGTSGGDDTGTQDGSGSQDSDDSSGVEDSSGIEDSDFFASDVITTTTPSAIPLGQTYPLSVNVSGLEGQGLQITSGASTVQVSSNGVVTLSSSLSAGTNQPVIVATQPANPAQQCTFDNGQTMTTAAVGFASITLNVTCSSTCPPACPDGHTCASNGDCASFVCTGGVCQRPSCAPSCGQGSPCGTLSDCASGQCANGSCQPASCAPQCGIGSRCGNNSDCASFVCTGGACRPPSCSPTCNQGAPCGSPFDCGSHVCVNGTCQAPFCAPTCGAGTACNNNGDCASSVCAGNVCQASGSGGSGDSGLSGGTAPSCSPSCTDGAACGNNNQCASFVCTGGACQPPSCSPACNQGAPCGANGDCGSRVCSGGTCRPPACSPTCASGTPCNNNGDCASFVCMNGACH
jgi:hypothetical protein